MKARDVFETLKGLAASGHALRLERRSLHGFEAYERSQTLKEARWWITVLSEVARAGGVWECYYAGVFADEGGSVLGAFATRYTRDDELGYTSSVTYAAPIAPATLVERYGEAVRTREGFREWRESVKEAAVEISAPEAVRELLRALRELCPYTRLSDAKGTPIRWPAL
jgi:hypothetical protein